MISPIPRLKSEVKALRRFPRFIAWNLLKNQKTPINRIIHIIEGGDWVINRIGNYIANGVNSRGLHCELDTFPRFYFNSLIHFGSVHTFVSSCFRTVHHSNKVITTIFHGDKGINPEMDTYIHKMLECQYRLSRIVVSNSVMKKRLISWGIPAEKLILIPIGVDLSHFKPAQEDKRNKLRNELGIPDDAICIGSFQKDGLGWGEGLKPKWIKGPDVFVEVLTRLAKNYKIHCLLTGPVRGYVKKRLESAGVTYTHRFLDNYLDIVDYYNCLDLYLVTSREEGGPKAIMESMATGVPLVSTRVGMAPDLIQDAENAFIVDIGDVKGIVNKAELILNNTAVRRKIIQNGFETVKRYDWNIIAGQYAELYKGIITTSEH